MKSLKTLAALLVLAFMAGIVPAFAVTLSLDDKGNGIVDVTVDDSSNVLGVAFTVNYDSTKLSQPTVTSTYFKTFTELQLSPATVDSYDSPLVTNETTGATINSLKISAARPTADSAVKTLFTITFSIVTGATGTANVSIVPTTMTAVAGYSAGDKLPVVVGYESSTDTYPILLSAATLTSSQVSADLITDSGASISVNVALNAGWNMFSLPVIPSDTSVTALFGSNLTVYKYENGYKSVSSLEPGIGYWVKVSSATTYTFTGSSYSSYSKSLVTGWNLVGSVNGSIIPSIVPTSTTVYGYNNGYKSVAGQPFEPGKAYWVKMASAGTISLVQE